MEGLPEAQKMRNTLSKRAPPPPRPTTSTSTPQDDLRSSDSDSRSYSLDSSLKLDLPRLKAVILGGGFAGVSLALALQKLSRIDVVLIDSKVLKSKFERFIYTPSLIQLFSIPEKREAVTIPYIDAIRNAKFICGTIQEVTRKTVKVDDIEMEFDYCFICTGMYYKVPGAIKRKTSSVGTTGEIASDSRKTPRRKRINANSSSKNHSFSIAQRFKAIFMDPIVGPIFRSFVASRADFTREQYALLLLSEINAFKAILSSNEKRLSSSSSSSSSSTVCRAARKLFATIIQKYIAPGAPYELRFNMNGKDTVKDYLLMADSKSIEPTVFKSTRRAIIALLSEYALEAFYEAACNTPAQPTPPVSDIAEPIPNIVTSHSSRFSSSHHASSKSNVDSTHTKTELAQDAKPAKRRRASSSSAINVSHINSHKTPHHGDSPGAHGNSNSASIPIIHAPLSTSLGGRSPTPTLPHSAGDRSPHSILSLSPRTIPRGGSSRLVMEVHEMHYSRDSSIPNLNSGMTNSEHVHSASYSSSTATTSTTNTTTAIPASTMASLRTYSSSPASPSASPPLGSSYSATMSSSSNIAIHLNHKYPGALIPPLKTLSPINTQIFLTAEEWDSVTQAKRVVIVGGDLVAIELAAEILQKHPEKKLTIVHSNRHLLTGMSENVRLIVDTFFKNRNVEVHRKTHVVAIQPLRLYPQDTRDIYHLLLDDGSTMEADKVYCCNLDYQHGNTSFLEKNFTEHLDGRGFAKVDVSLRFAGTNNMFALGDVAALNEYKIAERARAHASLVSSNIQRILHAMDIDPYRTRPIPKTFDLILGPTKGVQIENGRFVRIGPGPVERRDFAERRILHRFGAPPVTLLQNWLRRSEKHQTGEDETAGSRGDTSSDTPAVRTNKASRNRPSRKVSENGAEEDSDDAKQKKLKKSKS